MKIKSSLLGLWAIVILIGILFGSFILYNYINNQNAKNNADKTGNNLTVKVGYYDKAGQVETDCLNYQKLQYIYWGQVLENEIPKGYNDNPFTFKDYGGSLGHGLLDYKNLNYGLGNWSVYIFQNNKYVPSNYGIDNTAIANTKFAVEYKDINPNNQ